MKLITDIKEMQVWSRGQSREGKILSFVPTMGALHGGHLKLIERGKEKGNLLIVSIFINPVQFGPDEDCLSYPRDIKKDLRIAEDAGVDLVFAPSPEDMYPAGFNTYVIVKDVTQYLCGLSRPGHFMGVVTVVMKLFNIVMPRWAVFGKKDYQQLVVIKRMVKDMNFDIEIVEVPTVREGDGLAMSSRNSYLDKEERRAAGCLYSSLKIGREMFISRIRNPEKIIEKIKKRIEIERMAKIDYVKICDPETLRDVDIIQDSTLLAIAVKIGKTRLIDNCLLENTINDL